MFIKFRTNFVSIVFQFALLLVCPNVALAESLQDGYIKSIIASEAKDRSSFHEKITVDMFQEWMALDENSEEFDTSFVSGWFIDPRDAGELCDVASSALDIYMCLSELNEMTFQLQVARVEWLNTVGMSVDDLYKLHNDYEEQICNAEVSLDYGDISNTYSHIAHLSCSLRLSQQFTEIMSSFHGASFR